MTKYVDSGTYDFRIHSVPEINLKPSRTVPDQNYSMREILEKFTSGQPINGMGTYNDYDTNGDDQEIDFNDYMPHPRTLDLVDQAEYAAYARQQLHQFNESKNRKPDAPTPTPEP